MTIDHLFEKCSKLVLEHHLKKNPNDLRWIVLFHDTQKPDEPHPAKEYHLLVKPLGIVNIKCFSNISLLNDFIYETIDKESFLKITYKMDKYGEYNPFT